MISIYKQWPGKKKFVNNLVDNGNFTNNIHCVLSYLTCNALAGYRWYELEGMYSTLGFTKDFHEIKTLAFSRWTLSCLCSKQCIPGTLISTRRAIWLWLTHFMINRSYVETISTVKMWEAKSFFDSNLFDKSNHHKV